MKVATIVGTRPEIIRLSRVIAALVDPARRLFRRLEGDHLPHSPRPVVSAAD